MSASSSTTSTSSSTASSSVSTPSSTSEDSHDDLVQQILAQKKAAEAKLSKPKKSKGGSLKGLFSRKKKTNDKKPKKITRKDRIKERQDFEAEMAAEMKKLQEEDKKKEQEELKKNKGRPRGGSNQKAMFRFKTAFAQRVCDSKIGHKIIAYFVGPHGDSIFKWLQKAISRHQGELHAQKMKSYSIRFAIKCKFLHDAHFITQKDVFQISEPCNSFVLNLFENFKAVHEGDEKSVDAQVLNRQCQRLKNRLVTVVRPHMEANEVAKFNWVMALLGSVPFLEALYLHEDFATERKTIYEHLGTLLEPLLLDQDDEQCKWPSCSRRPVVMDPPELFTDFRHLGYCPKHHFKLHQNLAENPSVQHFSTNDYKYSPFKKVMKAALPANYLAFYRGSGNFQLVPWGQRKAFAMLMHKKYLEGKKSSHPVELPPDILEGIEKSWRNPTVDTFTDARNHVETVMGEVFQKVWVGSPEAAEYMRVLRLPDIMMETFLKKYKKKRGLS